MTTFELKRAFAYDGGAIYEWLTDIESYPQYMKNIDKVTIVECQADKAKTSWEATLDGKHIVWGQEDVFDRGTKTISYRLLEGDLSEMTGCWQVIDTAGGCEVKLHVSFAFANPILAMFAEPLLKRKLEENSLLLLDGIEEQMKKNG